MGKIRNSNQLAIIRDRIAAEIQSINSLMDIQQGHIIKDVVVDAPGQEFRYAYILLDYINTIKSLDGISSLINDTGFKEDIQNALSLDSIDDVITLISADLDDLASVHGVTRQAAVASAYMQRFYRADDNSGATIAIPVGTTVKTVDGTVVATVQASVPQVPILDTDNGLYYVEETVKVTEGGTTGNVALGTLTLIAPTIAQATSTSNVVILTTGADEETNLALIARLEDARKGRNLQTIAGWKKIALGTAEDSPLYFQGANVVDSSSALMTRAYAGAIDIFVIGKDIQSIEERILHTGDGSVYTLSYQPVETVMSVDGSISSLLTAVTVIDTTSATSGSTRAYTRITVSGGVIGETLTVSYRVDQAIIDAQRLIESDDEFTVPAADVLFRQATQISISINVQIFYFGTRAQANVELDIQSDLASFFDGGTTSNGEKLSAKGLGVGIDWSDVVSIINDVDDVDRITISGTNAIRFYKDGVQTFNDPITLEDNEYARLGTVTFI